MLERHEGPQHGRQALEIRQRGRPRIGQHIAQQQPDRLPVPLRQERVAPGEVRVVAAGTLISNQAVVETEEVPNLLTDGDGNPATGPEPTVVVVGSGQQLSITKQVTVVGGGPAVPGGTLEYVVTVANLAAVPAVYVVVTDDLDDTQTGYLTYVDQSATMNGSTGTTTLSACTWTSRFVRSGDSSTTRRTRAWRSVRRRFSLRVPSASLSSSRSTLTMRSSLRAVVPSCRTSSWPSWESGSWCLSARLTPRIDVSGRRTSVAKASLRALRSVLGTAPIGSWEVAHDDIVRPPKRTTHVVLDTPAGLHGKRLDAVRVHHVFGRRPPENSETAVL